MLAVIAFISLQTGRVMQQFLEADDSSFHYSGKNGVSYQYIVLVTQKNIFQKLTRGILQILPKATYS